MHTSTQHPPPFSPNTPSHAETPIIPGFFHLHCSPHCFHFYLSASPIALSSSSVHFTTSLSLFCLPPCCLPPSLSQAPVSPPVSPFPDQRKLSRPVAVVGVKGLKVCICVCVCVRASLSVHIFREFMLLIINTVWVEDVFLFCVEKCTEQSCLHISINRLWDFQDNCKDLILIYSLVFVQTVMKVNTWLKD